MRNPFPESNSLSIESGTVHQMFGLPFLAVRWPDSEEVNRSLTELILELEGQQPTVSQSNHGGWQSEKTLQTREHPAVRELLRWIDIGVYMLITETIGEEQVAALESKWAVNAWANVNRRGHFNKPHHHVGGFWSGVYYVSTGGADGSGRGAIGFRSPHQSGILAGQIRAPLPLRQAFRQDVLLQPRAGLMLLFPSWIEHQVYPHDGDEPRISIAFDVLFPGSRG